jgi:hypothetical protein
MNKHFAVLIIAALATGGACAGEQRGYLGLALATSGDMDAVGRSGARVDSVHSGFSGLLYGGYRLDDRFSLEAGYASWGSFTLPNVGPGAAGDARIKPSSVYAGVRADWQVHHRVQLFGKLKLVHTRVDVTGLGTEDRSVNRLMPGLGAEFRLTPRIGLTLEAARYGNVHVPQVGRLNFNRIEAGAKFQF